MKKEIHLSRTIMQIRSRPYMETVRLNTNFFFFQSTLWQFTQRRKIIYSKLGEWCINGFTDFDTGRMSFSAVMHRKTSHFRQRTLVFATHVSYLNYCENGDWTW